jgi:endo-alpha-1,4-polygalactosaminidase (GH114 family)
MAIHLKKLLKLSMKKRNKRYMRTLTTTNKSSYIKECLICKKEFKTYLSRIKIGKEKYCSKKCLFISRKGRKVWNIGLTKETDERILKASKLLKMYERTKEHCKKISIALTGNKHTEKTKEKMRKNHPDFFGDKNPNWKGDSVSACVMHF